MTSKPTKIIVERTIEPIIREINLSSTAWSCTPSGPSTRPADIWRNGEKSVFNKRANENESESPESCRDTSIVWRRQPAPYHHEKKAVNISLIVTPLVDAKHTFAGYNT